MLKADLNIKDQVAFTREGRKLVGRVVALKGRVACVRVWNVGDFEVAYAKLELRKKKTTRKKPSKATKELRARTGSKTAVAKRGKKKKAPKPETDWAALGLPAEGLIDLGIPDEPEPAPKKASKRKGKRRDERGYLTERKAASQAKRMTKRKGKRKEAPPTPPRDPGSASWSHHVRHGWPTYYLDSASNRAKYDALSLPDAEFIMVETERGMRRPGAYLTTAAAFREAMDKLGTGAHRSFLRKREERIQAHGAANRLNLIALRAQATQNPAGCATTGRYAVLIHEKGRDHCTFATNDRKMAYRAAKAMRAKGRNSFVADLKLARNPDPVPSVSELRSYGATDPEIVMELYARYNLSTAEIARRVNKHKRWVESTIGGPRFASNPPTRRKTMAKKSTREIAKRVLTPKQYAAWCKMSPKLSAKELLAGKKPGQRKAAPKKRKGTRKMTAAQRKAAESRIHAAWEGQDDWDQWMYSNPGKKKRRRKARKNPAAGRKRNSKGQFVKSRKATKRKARKNPAAARKAPKGKVKVQARGSKSIRLYPAVRGASGRLKVYSVTAYNKAARRRR